MAAGTLATWILEQEARALLTRLALVKPFVLHETMVPAAAISPAAQLGIDRFLDVGRRRLREQVNAFVAWLRGPAGRRADPALAQRRFSFLRLRFNAVLTQFDTFADAITQRSEHETGTWLAGLDVVAADALALPGRFYEVPPVICYLDRGAGAAIRRARTRLPGGGSNPVAIVSLPRERLIGSGIASSLVHEVGHQGAALLDLIPSLRVMLRSRQRGSERNRLIWRLWDRWIGEIVADFWSVAKIGVASTVGLMGVVSLPRFFVFRFNIDDPHPTPWLRVKLSGAIGGSLYPHPQWPTLSRLWESFYPLEGLDEERRQLLLDLQASIPAFVSVLINHRPPALRGRSLIDVMAVHVRQPARLAAYFRAWQADTDRMSAAPPSLAFAVIGQARMDGTLSPELESRLLKKLLTSWAMRRALDVPAGALVQRRTAAALLLN